MLITIVVIDHAQQRYETIGDWQWSSKGDLTITVSDMKDWRYNLLVARHELDEAILCRDKSISQKEVDQFDVAYEAVRLDGDTSEPGDDPKAPYYNEHQFATKLEREMARELNVDWEKYNEAVNSL